MPSYGLCLLVTHTGKAADSVHISDIRDGIDLLGGAYGFRKPGAIYVPVPAKGGQSLLVYSGDVAVSFETGGIRQFIDTGYLTAEFIIGSVLGPALFPEVQDEGILVDPATQIFNFTGAGVTATQTVAGEVQVNIPGAGGGDHSLLLPASLVWPASAHTGTPGSLAAFDAAGATTYVTGVAQGDVAYFDGNIWTILPPGVPGEALLTQGLGANPLWGAASSSQLLWGSNSVGSSTTTRYLTPGFDNQLAQTVAIQIRASRAGTLRNLRVHHRAGAGNGNNIVYTIRINGVPTALTVTMASTANDGSDLANTVVVAANDLIDIEVTKAASTGSSPNDITATVEFV